LILLEKDNKDAIKYNSMWYEERMVLLDKYKEQELMENKMNNEFLVKSKLKKF
jgi:hypothetical protein